jgi:hypothetical protein
MPAIPVTRRNSESGFSLNELVIAAGLLSLIIVGSGIALIQITGAQVGANEQVQKIVLASDWSNRAKLEANCTTSITKGNPVVTPTVAAPGITEIEFDLADAPPGGASTIMRENQTLAKYNLRIQNDGFRFIVPANATREASGTTFLWHGYVELGLEKVTSASAGSQTFRPHIIGPLSMRVDAANNILGCVGDDQLSPADYCALLGGTWNGTNCATPAGCPVGSVLVGPNIPADCLSCPADHLIVSSGGIPTCQPYIICPPGTSKTGAGGAAAPPVCKCTVVGQIWNGVSCGATVALDGLCGGANGGTFADATSANAAGLCNAGTASPVALAGAGPWSWNCIGANGGISVACSATDNVAACPTGSSAMGTGDPTSVVNCVCDTATPRWAPVLGQCRAPFGGGGGGTCNDSSGWTSASCSTPGQILRSAAASCDCPSGGGFINNRLICQSDGMGGFNIVWQCSPAGFPAMSCQCD